MHQLIIILTLERLIEKSPSALFFHIFAFLEAKIIIYILLYACHRDITLWEEFSRRWPKSNGISTNNQENFPFGSLQDSSYKHLMQLGPTSLCKLGPIDSRDVEHVRPRRSQGQLQWSKLCRGRPRHQTSVSFNSPPNSSPVRISLFPSLVQWQSRTRTVSCCPNWNALVIQVVLITFSNGLFIAPSTPLLPLNSLERKSSVPTIWTLYAVTWEFISCVDMGFQKKQKKNVLPSL